jgi:hypothetical protein
VKVLYKISLISYWKVDAGDMFTVIVKARLFPPDRKAGLFASTEAMVGFSRCFA